MKRTVLAMLAAGALSGCGASNAEMAKTQPAFTADDESAVRTLVSEFANTWNRHDMKGMHDLDTEDVEWINVVGHHWRGKTTVYKGHAAIHKGMSATTTAKVDTAIVRSIDPTVAIAVVTFRFVATQDPRYPWAPPSTSKTRASFAMVKREGIWKIVHFQNTIIDPRAENDDVPKFDATGFPPPRNP